MSIWYKVTALVIALVIAGEISSRYFGAVETRKEAIALAQSQAETLRARQAELSAEKVALEQEQASAPALWRTSDDLPPIGDAQNALVDLATASGAVLKSLRSEDGAPIGSVSVMRLTLEVEADIAEWQDLVRRVHQNVPTILPVSTELRRLNRSAPDAIYPETLIRMTVDIPYAKQGLL